MCIVNLLVLVVVIGVVGLVDAAFPFYNVLDYGARGDSRTDDTQAFLKAWEAACGDKNSPTLFIPSQKTFFLTQIEFRGPCKSSMHVQITGDLVAPNKVWTNELATWIVFKNISYLTIDGSGHIDGKGSIWWNCKINRQCNYLPNSFGVLACQDVKIRNLNFLDSAGKHLTLQNSVRVHIRKLRITAPGESPNTDGIFMQESQHVHIHDSFIGTGDDCVAIGKGSMDVNVSSIDCGPGHGISIGSLGISDSKEVVEQIRVTNCNFTKTMYGARIKTWQGGSGYARSISFEHIRFDSVTNPILIDQYYCNGAPGCQNSTSAVQVSDVTFFDARGTGSGKVAISLACSKNVACIGVALRDISIKSVPGIEEQSTYCLNAVGTKSGEITPEISCLSWRN